MKKRIGQFCGQRSLLPTSRWGERKVRVKKEQEKLKPGLNLGQEGDRGENQREGTTRSPEPEAAGCESGGRDP